MFDRFHIGSQVGTGNILWFRLWAHKIQANKMLVQLYQAFEQMFRVESAQEQQFQWGM
jgi:hypothetical protein